MISIIVPTYNVEPYIVDCLRSVAAQTYAGEMECIVVDDCGTDNSMALVDNYIRNYKGKVRFNVLRRKANGGLSAARNTGLAAARGEYVMFLDSDDELTPGAIAALAEPARKNPEIDLVVGHYIPVAVNGVASPLKMIPGTQLTLDSGAFLKGDEIIESYLRGEWFAMTIGKLYRKNFLDIERLRFKDGLIHEDELWSFQVGMRAKTMAVIEETTYLYKLRPGSITTATKNYMRLTLNKLVILCGIYSEISKAGKLTSAMFQDAIERWLTAVLADAWRTGDKSFFSRVYSEVRERIEVNFSDIASAYGYSPTRLVKSIHWLIPAGIASRGIWRMFNFKN